MNSPTSPLATRCESTLIAEPPRESILGRYRVPLSWGIIGILLVKEVTARGDLFNRIDQSTPTAIIGLSMILLGVLLRTWANGILHKNRVLTTAGPYQLIRHPLYAGTLSMMTGACLLFTDIIVAVSLVLLIVTSYRQSIQYEERKLAHRFGMIWTEYSKAVPSLLPRLPRNGVSFTDWQAERWMKNGEHKTLLATLAILAFFEAYQLMR